MDDEWELKLPEPIAPPERPPFDPDTLPLGTTAEKPGVMWYVVWDNQDKKHYWNDKNEDV